MGRRNKRQIQKCPNCARIVSALNICSVCDVQDDSPSDSEVFEVTVLPLPNNSDCITLPDGISCYCCKRMTTDSFPLQFHQVNHTDLFRRQKYGLTCNSGHVTLCQLCSSYLNATHPRFHKVGQFKNAWPAVFWNLLSDENIRCNFWQFIPITMRPSWIHQTSFANSVFRSRVDLVSIPVFDDVTQRLKEFNAFKENMLLSEMVKKINEEYFPCVKCPVGCEEFLDECGKIEFQHYIGRILPSFNHFGCQPNEYLLGIRPDYELTDYIFPNDPTAPMKKPTMLISNDGVFLLTCRDHNKKINKQYLHLPKHPAGRIFNPLPDRFAPAVLSTRTMKPFRENFSSASYKMVRLQASFAGINTCYLTETRSFDKMCDEAAEHESFYLHTRNDTQTIVRKLMQDGSISSSFGHCLLNTKNDDWLTQVEQLENDCNYIPLETVGFLRFARKLPTLEPLPTLHEDVLECEGEVFTLEAEQTSEPEIENQQSQLIDDPNENQIGGDTGIDSIFSQSPSHNDNVWQKTLFPCVKIMDRSLGAPPTTYVTGSEKTKLIMDLSANSVLFMGNVIQGHIRKQRFSSKILDCYCLKKKRSFKSSLNQALRIIERELEESSILESLEKLPFIKCFEVTNRETPIDADIVLEENHDFVAYISNCHRRRSVLPPNEILSSPHGEYKLVYLVTNENDSKFFFRYKCCQEWWDISKQSRPMKTGTRCLSQILINNNWKITIYEKINSKLGEEERSQDVRNVFGQQYAKCNEHRLLLACDFPNNAFFCQFDDGCTNKSAWRCPSENCESALCRKHLQVLLEDFVVTSYPGKNDRLRPSSNVIDQESEESEAEASTNNVEVPTDSGVIDSIDVLQTDAGAEAVNYSSSEDYRSIGSHVILNAVCSLLLRPRTPTYFRKKEWRFLQSFIAKCPGESVPLTFPEAMLLPSIYYMTMNNSICGAIPAPLFASTNITKSFNIAGLIAHIRSRLKNFSLLTSSDPRIIQFYFDCFLNFQMTSMDSRFVLNRGLQEINSIGFGTSQAIENMNEEDSRKVVNELAAAIRSEEPTFFLTLTLNQSRMFGVAPLHDVIERNTANLSTAKRRNIKEGFMPLYMRLWERAATFMIRYIERSNDKPLGTITNIFPRFEFQTSKGNAPHLHVIIWTLEKKSDPIIKQKIVGSFRQLLHELKVELQDTTNSQVSSEEDVEDLLLLAKSTLNHSCEKANYRCHKKCDNSGQTICRFKIYEPCAETFFKLIDRPHTEDVWEILQKMELAHLVGGKFDVTGVLKAGSYNYAADLGETFSPVVTKIFTLVKGSMNCLICDAIMSATYLAKYAAGVEEHATVKISGESSETVSVSVKKMKNIKIAGARISASKENDKSSAETCRVLSSTECIWSMLDLKYVFPTYTCIHVNTLPLERRSCVQRRQKYRRQVDLSGQNDQDFQFANVRKSMSLPQNRFFTPNQEKTLREYVKSGLSLDKVSQFALRPPELLFVNDIETYFRYFSFQKIKLKDISNYLSTRLFASCWVDAVGNLVKLRGGALEFFKSILRQNCSNQKEQYRFFASKYLEIFNNHDLSRLVDNREDQAKPVVVVFPNVIPRHVPNFLISFLLQFGKYETEFDLYEGGTTKKAFQTASLINDAEAITDGEIVGLLKTFILKRVIYVPGSHVSQDRQIVDANMAFRTLLDENANTETPTIVYSALQEECTSELLSSVNEKFSAVVSQIHDLVQDTSKPDVQSIIDCNLDSPLAYNPLESQNVVFNDEQAAVVSSLIKTIDEYKNYVSFFFKHQLVVGMPGSGKTFLITNVLLYALCQGLNVMVTSLSSERAMQFSGMHIHDVFCLPVSTTLNVDCIVQQGLQKLRNDIPKQILMKRIDILYFEEIGMVSAEEFAAIDHILQKTRDSYAPFGGVLILGTGDPKQLPPPQGRLLWTSPLIITSVRMFSLTRCVRMADVVGRQFLEMLSVPSISADDSEKILKTFAENCKFCDSDNSPVDAIRIFGTRAAELKAILAQICRITSSGQVVTELQCVDELKLNCTSNWNTAPLAAKRALNRKCLEPEVLYCYENALLRITMNIPSLNVSQGQMCVFNQFFNEKSIEVIVAPPGVRKLPDKNGNGEYMFVEKGWFSVTVHKQTGFVHNFKGSSLRRTQFPLKNFMAMTIHKAMGETIGKIVTKIDFSEREYCLWEREQLYVLVSRVQHLGDITFLGEKTATLASIRKLLTQTSQWDEYTETLVRTSANQADAIFNLARVSPYRPRKIELPPGEVGFVYLLVSTKDAMSTYVGQTSDLRRRLREHNSGNGSYLTNQPHLRPWGVLCFATGFSDIGEVNKRERTELEHFIHHQLFTNFNVHNRQATPQQVLDLFVRCVQETKITTPGLRAVVTGAINTDF